MTVPKLVRVIPVRHQEGEYAYLKEDGSDNEIFIAMALLPPDIDIGTKLKYELFEYSII